MEVKSVSNNIDVSIIVPFYKGNLYLEKLFCCIRKNAEFAEQIKIELVLVNDSPQYELNYNIKWVHRFELRIINNPTNYGIQKSRIVGIKAARGQFVIMLDQDDLLHDHAVLSQMREIKDNDIVVGNGFDENPVSYGVIYRSVKQQKHVQKLYYYYLVGNMIVSPGQCMIKKSIIPNDWLSYAVKNNGSDDLLLWILLLKRNCKWAINTDILYRHVFTGQNVSADLDKMITSTNEVVKYLKSKSLLKAYEIKFIERRSKMRKLYEGKSVAAKIIAYIKYPDIAAGLIMNRIG